MRAIGALDLEHLVGVPLTEGGRSRVVDKGVVGKESTNICNDDHVRRLVLAASHQQRALTCDYFHKLARRTGQQEAVGNLDDLRIRNFVVGHA